MILKNKDYEYSKKTKNNGLLCFKEIDYHEAKEIVVKNHYSKKWNNSFGKINIGIFRDDVLLGVAVFGSLMNPNSYKNFNDDFNKDSIIELNRLWVDDILGKNTETVFLSACFKIIKRKYKNIYAVQSFADGRLGCGTIYKASNFKYYGAKESLFFENIETGETLHKVPLENTKRPLPFISKNLDYMNGKLKPFKVKTYRYIYPLKRNLKININELAYPKYDIGLTYIENYQHSLSCLIRVKIMLSSLPVSNNIIEKVDNFIWSNYEKSTILSEIEKQMKNESINWFKTVYIENKSNIKKISGLIDSEKKEEVKSYELDI